MAGVATVNFSEDAYASFNGYYGAASTYGSFSYLKYGPLRLFSQIAQDSNLKVGKFIWVVGHSGPETAEDSRTHFGIFAPGVTQLFPDGHIINLHPWEHNEVAPSLTAALQTEVPIIAIHLTRPPITIPDRKAMNIASHLDASKGAYIIKDFDHGEKKGVVIVRGTSSTNSLIQILSQIKKDNINIKIVAAISWELFNRQDKQYREFVIAPDEWHDSMIITNGSIKLMQNWISNFMVKKYSLAPDHDNKWRTGGSVDQIIAESHLDSDSLLNGIKKFVQDRSKRLLFKSN
jgi:transketolase